MAETGSAASPWPHPTLTGEAPIVIAHRGASAYLPEHTLEAYALAIEMGADYIEPDLVMTKDGHLIARHDSYLSSTTDVADRPDFADRRSTRDGRTDWFVDDFTLAEIKTLRAVQPFPGRETAYDGRFAIPTFGEILALVRHARAAQDRPVGVYPETKHPSAFAARGLDMAGPLLAALDAAGMTGRAARVYIQSFEPEFLQRLDAQSDLPLIQLVYPVDTERDGAAASVALSAAAAYADGVGPSKALLIDEQGRDTGYVTRAHDLGLAVHPWTHRMDRVGAGYRDGRVELQRLYALGIDGVFSDFPDVARAVRALEAGRWRDWVKAASPPK